MLCTSRPCCWVSVTTASVPPRLTKPHSQVTWIWSIGFLLWWCQSAERAERRGPVRREVRPPSVVECLGHDPVVLRQPGQVAQAVLEDLVAADALRCCGGAVAGQIRVADRRCLEA